jgi:hypothetical protein
MDRIEHYNEALRFLEAARISQEHLTDDELTGMSAVVIETRMRLIATTVATAQVHATLFAALHS